MTSVASATVGFTDLGLAEPILRAITDSGYTEPTPIQVGAIPEVLAGRDVIGIAQTGTGKTASFVLPMLHILANGRGRARMPRSLVLSPTRELATQTSENFDRYGRHLNLTMALLIGGVGMGEQEKLLEKGVDVLIATPGRLLDWFDRGRVLLGGVNILVIDEADRMLDMGFLPDIERIMSALPNRQQTLLFSATMPPAIRKLVETFLKDPAQITVSRPASTGENVEAFVVPVRGDDKRAALLRLIRQEDIGKAIVFLNRKREVSALCRWLVTKGVNARDIHGDLEQAHRTATLNAFKADQVDFLIATDVAARGLDISAMPNVINFDVPFSPDDYVHRIGRTARAGLKGRAFTFATGEEGKLIAAVERLTGRAIATRELNGAGAEPARRRVAESVRAPAAEPLPQPETAPVPELVPMPELAEAPPPRRGRRRPSRRPEVEALVEAAPEAEALASPSPPPEVAEPPRRGRRRPSRRPDVEALVEAAPEVAAAQAIEPAEPEPVMEPLIPPGRQPPARNAPQRRDAGRQRATREPADAPVIGLGDHVPGFLLRPVPLDKLGKGPDAG